MNKWIYIFIMFAITYLIRVLPLTLIRKKLKNTFIRSFLYYVPYVTLSVMTFPATVMLHIGIYNRIFYCIKKLTLSVSTFIP